MPNQTLYDNFSQVRQYIDQEKPDLSSYVSKSELAACSYVTKDELSAQSYLTAVPNTYPTYTAIESMGYMTQAASYAYLSVENLRTNNNRPVQLRATGLQFISSNYTIAPREISYEYINTSAYNNAWIGNTTLKNYVNGRLVEIEASYVTSSDLPVIDESIVPKENNTYTLGDVSHRYSATYTSGLFIHPHNGWVNVSNWQTKFRIDNADKYYLTSNRFYPYITGACHLGSSGNKWGDTYTANIYADNAYISNYNNFIWTGTSTEYAALSDYTTYQFYLVQES